MSHNGITVAEQQPDSTGNINVSLEDLADVTGTASNNQTPIWDGSQWTFGTGSGGSSSAEYILVGQGESADYNTSGATLPFSANDDLRIYDTSPYNTITNSTITKHSTTDWVTGVTLPVGSYQVMFQTNVTFTGSGYMSFRIVDTDPSNTSNGLSVTMVIGDNAGLVVNGATTTINSFFELTASKTIAPRIITFSNTGGNAPFTPLNIADNTSTPTQGNTISENTYMLITKIG